MKNPMFLAAVLAAAAALGACAQGAPPEEEAPRVTFSGPDYIVIRHKLVDHGPPPFDALVLAERYCAASGKSADVTPYGRYRNSTSFVCVSPGEKAK